MLSLYPCKKEWDSPVYYGCDKETKADCVLCDTDIRGFAKVCEPCGDIEYCQKKSRLYIRGKILVRPQPIMWCKKFLKRRQAYIHYLIVAWKDLPSKEGSITFVNLKSGKGYGEDGFRGRDLEIINDKRVLEYELMPKRLGATEIEIIHSVMEGKPLSTIAKKHKMNKTQVTARYKQSLKKLAIVREKPSAPKPREVTVKRRPRPRGRPRKALRTHPVKPGSKSPGKRGEK